MLGGALWTVGGDSLVGVWFCSVPVVFLWLGEVLRVLEMVVSGLVLLSGGRLEEEEEEEVVGTVSLLEFDWTM